MHEDKTHSAFRFQSSPTFFPTNKQYIKIKVMQNETNPWSIFFGKDEILVKL